jgi:dihydrofolate reductase
MNGIVCVNNHNGIGYKTSIPWHSKEDFSHFRTLTIGNGNNAIVMGNETFKSLNCKPLSNRQNYVLTRNSLIREQRDDVKYETQMENILLLPLIFDEVFIIGGQEIYKLFENHYKKIYLTQIESMSLCDTFFTVDLEPFNSNVTRTIVENGKLLRFIEYTR